VARDRKRAKQRRERRGNAGAGRAAAAPTPAAKPDANGAPPVEPADGAPNGAPATPAHAGDLERADVPAALDHASAEVDEFDAALVAGAHGVPADPETLSEEEIEAEALSEGDISEDQLQEPAGALRTTPGGGGAAGGVSAEQASGAPIRKGNRAIGFLRASWAELQRVQWPDRRQVTQATAVVLGFVAIAGLYLGLADYVAKEFVELIL
jgi:preprotein translocase subunit SecE